MLCLSAKEAIVTARMVWDFEAGMAAVPERADLFTTKFIIPPVEFAFYLAAETIFTRYGLIIEVFISVRPKI